MLFNNPSATIPETLQTDRFMVHPLNETYAAVDYEAYMASPNVIRLHSAGRWQVEGYTLEENQFQATAHGQDHQARRSFAFILLAPDETRSLGCIYFNPLRDFLERVEREKRGGATIASLSPPLQEIADVAEAMVTFWVREDEQEGELPEKVVSGIEQWVRNEWTFEGHLWRIRQEETRSNLALERVGLQGRYGIEVEGIGRYGFFG